MFIDTHCHLNFHAFNKDLPDVVRHELNSSREIGNSTSYWYNTRMSDKRPYFIWDYDLTEDDIHQLLREGNDVEKIWILSRILESATYEDVWKYTTLKEVKEWFPRLKLKKPIRNVWAKALAAWEEGNEQKLSTSR